MHIYTYVYMYITQYPIPNTKKGHQKIPFLLTSLHNSDLQSLYSRDFVVSPVSKHFPYSWDFVVSRHDYDVKMMMMMNVMPRSH